MSVALGYIGQQIARGVGAVLQQASNRQVIQNFLKQMQDNVAGLEPSLSGIKDAVLDRYTRLTKFRDSLYGTRDAAGRAIEGYPTGLEEGGGIAKVIEDAQAGNVGRDKATAHTKAVASQMDRALGLVEQRQALAKFEAEQKAYEDELAAFVKKRGRMPSAVEQQIARNSPDKLALPTPPEPFESVPIKAEQMAEARRVVNRAKRKARDAATRTQLGILKSTLDDTAASTAREAGVDVATYERRQAVADKFNKEKIVPMQALTGRRTVLEARAQMSNADFYNMAVHAVRGNDREKQRAFYEVLGQRGREEARKAITHDMLGSASKGLSGSLEPRLIAKYIKDNATGLETILGREEFEKLKGMGVIMESMAGEIKERGFAQGVAHHSWLLGFGAIKMAEGELREGFKLGEAAVTVEVLRAAARMISKVPRVVGPLLPRAAKTSLNSPELRNIMRSVDLAMAMATRTAQRLVPQATGGEPVKTGLSVGGEIAGGLF